MARDVTDYYDSSLKTYLDKNVKVERQPLFELCGLQLTPCLSLSQFQKLKNAHEFDKR